MIGQKCTLAITIGCNTGIGFESAVELAKMGAHIVMGCRNATKTQKAMDDIRKRVPNSKLEFIQLDLSSLRSVKAFVEQVIHRNLSVSVLINNAGVNSSAFPEGAVSIDNYEAVFATNHIGPFYLTLLLLPVLEAARPSRVVNVSSVMHHFGSLDFESTARAPGAISAYSTSKLANIYHAYEVHRRFARRGITSIAVSPGAVNSDIWRYERADPRRGFLGQIKDVAMRFLFLTPAQGSATSVHAATCAPPEADELKYFIPYYPNSCIPLLSELMTPFAGPRLIPSKPITYRLDVAASLWELSERLIAEALRIPEESLRIY